MVEAKKKRPRSPAYPGLDLGTAIEKARLVETSEGRNPTPVSVALGDMGYTAKSGAGWAALAALLKFGLLSEEGSGDTRKVRITDKGFRILVAEPSSPERQSLIREAAFLPPIHREIWGKYDGRLPSDANLIYHLRTERNFTEVGAREFIRELRSTLAFAGVDEGESLTETDEQEEADEEETDEVAPFGHQGSLKAEVKGGQGRVRVVQIPISLDEWAALQVPIPLTEEKWEQMMRVLAAMKPGIVTNVQPVKPLIDALSTLRTREGLTQEAAEVVRRADEDGSVAMYVTQNLERIANENGIDVEADMTPNEVIDALRKKIEDYQQ